MRIEGGAATEFESSRGYPDSMPKSPLCERGHAASRRAFQSRRKTRTEFQLRVVGVTAIKSTASAGLLLIAIGTVQPWRLDSCMPRVNPERFHPLTEECVARRNVVRSTMASCCCEARFCRASSRCGFRLDRAVARRTYSEGSIGVGQLDPDRANISDRAVDGILRRHRWPGMDRRGKGKNRRFELENCREEAGGLTTFLDRRLHAGRASHHCGVSLS